MTSTPASAVTDWHQIHASWGTGITRLTVGDTFSTNDKSWVAGTVVTSAGVSLPAVQVCTFTTCTLTHLSVGDNPDGGFVSGVSGTSDTDVWATGALFGEDGNESMSWHWDGTSWTNVNGVSTNSVMTHVLSVSATESWAIGWDDYEDGTTNTVYHRVGSTWTEVNSILDPIFPGACAEWYFNIWSAVTFVGGFPVIVGSCDGTPTILKERPDGSWQDIDAGLPAGATYSHATVFDSQLWVTGTLSGGGLSIERRASGVWQAVSTTGLSGATAGAGGSLSALAARNSKLVVVGHTGDFATPTAASWQWTGTGWTALSTPGGAGTSNLTAVDIAANGHTSAAGVDTSQPVTSSALLLTHGG
jgi:hypothetical protein